VDGANRYLLLRDEVESHLKAVRKDIEGKIKGLYGKGDIQGRVIQWIKP
jgi:hypothetical protein